MKLNKLVTAFAVMAFSNMAMIGAQACEQNFDSDYEHPLNIVKSKNSSDTESYNFSISHCDAGLNTAKVEADKTVYQAKANLMDHSAIANKMASIN